MGISEKELLKALNELEAQALHKGDALQNQDPEGGLPHEGTRLSRKGKKNKRPSLAKNMDASSDADSGSDEASGDNDSESDDNYSADDESADADSKSIDKAVDKGSDDMSSPMAVDKARKSFDEYVDGNETLMKGLEISPFLQEITATIGESHNDLRKSFNDFKKELRKGLLAEQQSFNGKLAKGLIALSDKVDLIENQNAQIMGALARLMNLPVTPRPRAVLSQAEIQQPPLAKSFNGNNTVDTTSADMRPKLASWVTQKALAKELDPVSAIKFETGDGTLQPYDIRLLPPNMQKSLVSDLGLDND